MPLEFTESELGEVLLPKGRRNGSGLLIISLASSAERELNLCHFSPGKSSQKWKPFDFVTTNPVRFLTRPGLNVTTASGADHQKSGACQKQQGRLKNNGSSGKYAGNR